MRARDLLLPVTVALSLGAALPARSQNRGEELQGLLSGRSGPVSLKLKDLNPEWHRVTIAGPKDQGGGAGGLMQMMSGMMGAMLGGMFGGGGGGGAMPQLSAPPPAYTQGRTVSLGGETYLVVYRPPTQRFDMSTFMKLGEAGELPQPEALTPETTLSLSLVNVRSIETLGDIRSFNLDQELAESAKAAEAERALLEQFRKGAAGGVGAAEAVLIPEPEATGVEPPQPAPKPAPKKPAPKKPAPRPRRR